MSQQRSPERVLVVENQTVQHFVSRLEELMISPFQSLILFRFLIVSQLITFQAACLFMNSLKLFAISHV